METGSKSNVKLEQILNRNRSIRNFVKAAVLATFAFFTTDIVVDNARLCRLSEDIKMYSPLYSEETCRRALHGNPLEKVGAHLELIGTAYSAHR